MPIFRPLPSPHPQAIRSARVRVRGLSRSSAGSGGSSSPEDKGRSFLVSIGHEGKVAEGVVKALKASGVSGPAILTTIRALAGRWEVGEDAGLEALVASVRQEISRNEGKAKVTFFCVPPEAWSSDMGSETARDNRERMLASAFEVVALIIHCTRRCFDTSHKSNSIYIRSQLRQVSAFEGMSITDVAKFGENSGSQLLGEYLECACSGIMACSTCQIVVDEDWLVSNP